MNVLGIYKSAAQSCGYVNKIKLNHTGNYTPILVIKVYSGSLLLRKNLLIGKFQIYARCQSHLVVTLTVVTCAVVYVLLFPVVVCGSWRKVWVCVGAYYYVALVCAGILVAGLSNVAMTVTYTSVTKVNIAGKCAKIVYNTVNAKIVTVLLVLVIGIACA